MIIDSWEVVLEVIPTEELEDSFRVATRLRDIKSATFPVNALEIFNAWKNLKRPQYFGEEEAWGYLLDGLRRTQRHSPADSGNAFIDAVAKKIGEESLRDAQIVDGAKTFKFAYREAVKQALADWESKVSTATAPLVLETATAPVVVIKPRQNLQAQPERSRDDSDMSKNCERCGKLMTGISHPTRQGECPYFDENGKVLMALGTWKCELLRDKKAK